MLEVQSAAGRTVFEEAQKWEGQVLANGNFRLRRYLGGSDHSAVFLTDIGVGQIRPPAIKLIAADPATADIQLARWKAAAKLAHPNLLQIFDSGRCQLNGEELLFVVTENADETLAEILRERPLTPDEAGEMLKPILEALSYLHDNGYSAGRLSPSNVMAIGDHVKLSSDGVCRTGSPVLSQAKPYDPPEAAFEGLTPAGDSWGLAMTIAEALTQRLPIRNDSLDELTFSDSVPEPFSDIVRHCLARDPRRRWTMGDIKSRLKQPAALPLAEEPPRSKPELRAPTWTKRGTHWLYALPSMAMLAAVLLLAIALGHRASRESQQSSTPQPDGAPVANPSVQKRSSHKQISASRNGVQARSEPSTVAAEGVVHRAVPSVPEKALRTIHGRVRVNVKVTADGYGNVARTELASVGPSRYFANLAFEAAHDWKFSQGKAGRSWLVQFVFQNTGVTVAERELPSGA